LSKRKLQAPAKSNALPKKSHQQTVRRRVYFLSVQNTRKVKNKNTPKAKE